MRNGNESLDRQLQRLAGNLPIAERTRAIAEAIRAEAAANLRAMESECETEQGLADKLRVEPGSRPGEWLVTGAGDYGRQLEFGTKNSPEWPWLLPALAMAGGLIRNCLRRTQRNGFLRTRRLTVDGESGPAVNAPP